MIKIQFFNTLPFLFRRTVALGDGMERHVISRQHDTNPRQILLPEMVTNLSHVVESQPRLFPSNGMVFGLEADDVRAIASTTDDQR